MLKTDLLGVAGPAYAGTGVAADPSKEHTVARRGVGGAPKRLGLVPGQVLEVWVMAAGALDLAAPEQVRYGGGGGEESVYGPDVLGQVVAVGGAGAGREVSSEGDISKGRARGPQAGPCAVIGDRYRVVIREAAAVGTADVQPACGGVAYLVVARLSSLANAVVLVERPIRFIGVADSAARSAGTGADASLAGEVGQVIKGGGAVVAAKTGERRSALVDVSGGAADGGAIGCEGGGADRPVPQRRAADGGSVVRRVTEYAYLGCGGGGEVAVIVRVAKSTKVMP